MTNEISTVLRNNRAHLHSRANVVATGIGYKVTGGKKTTTLSIICSVEQKVPAHWLEKKDLIPSMVCGVPTDVIQTGTIRAFQSRTERVRPAPGGVSIGHMDVTAGTLGCLVRKDGLDFILSNNHVLANSNDAAIGDPILQPGTYDGGTSPLDVIANLTQFVPISFTGDVSECPIATGAAAVLNVAARTLDSSAYLQAISMRAIDNLVDAAIALPVTPDYVINRIMDIGYIQDVRRGELGMWIQKSGRTTGVTIGEITQVEVTVTVQYADDKLALFTNQFMAGAMSQGGDSGSVILDNVNNLVGLLFAGSANTTIFNNIEHVFSALGVGL